MSAAIPSYAFEQRRIKQFKPKNKKQVQQNMKAKNEKTRKGDRRKKVEQVQIYT